MNIHTKKSFEALLRRHWPDATRFGALGNQGSRFLLRLQSIVHWLKLEFDIRCHQNCSRHLPAGPSGVKASIRSMNATEVASRSGTRVRRPVIRVPFKNTEM